MYAYTMLPYICYATIKAHFVPPHEYNNHEYNDRVDLIIQNRMTGRYAP